MKTIHIILAALFTLTCISPQEALALSTKKYYCIQAKVSKRNLSVNRSTKAQQPIVQRSGNTVDNHWRFIPAGGGYYYIRSKHSGLFLDVKGANRNARTIVWQFPFNGTDAQKWKLKEAGGAYYYIQSKVSGLYLDVKGGSTANNVTIWQFPLNRTDAQKWRLLSLGGNVSNISRAVHAALYGPKTNEVQIFGHQFNFIKNLKVKRTARGGLYEVTGYFQRHLTARPDDHYRFKAIFDQKGNLRSFKAKIKDGILSNIPIIDYPVTLSHVWPVSSIHQDGSSDTKLEQVYHRLSVHHKKRKSWKAAAKDIAIILSAAAIRG